MKLPNKLNIAKLTFISILMIALGSGCFFAGMNWSTWFPEVAEVTDNRNPQPPSPQSGPVGGNEVATSANGEGYTDFNYNGTTYRVEKSLLTEAGSKYYTNKRFYRFLNNKWEMREGTADAKWKPATPSSNIPLILAKWDEKFRAEEAKNKADLAQTKPQTPAKKETTPPKITTPPVTSTPPADTKPPKESKPHTEIPKVTPPTKKTLTPSEKSAIYKEIEMDVRAGKCTPDCIINKVAEFQFTSSQQQRLMNQMP